MPGPPKPKSFVAVRDVTVAGRRYSVGDPVDDRRVLDRLLRYGDQFVAAKRSKPAPAEPPAVDTATTPPESTKED
jgi:hypothetical protein